MPKWETCEIAVYGVREYEVKRGLFSTTVIPGIDRWEARKTEPSGTQTIYKSEEWECGLQGVHWSYKDAKREAENAEREYKKMISHLFNEGWETAASTRQEGITWITLMKRPIPEPEPQSANDPTNLLV